MTDGEASGFAEQRGEKQRVLKELLLCGEQDAALGHRGEDLRVTAAVQPRQSLAAPDFVDDLHHRQARGL
eukprot:CAMPEP_0205882920 /NCGR_PEP_ID=MMETSP1083-20121108/17261_1 /ASSEMBLY_ACC=CAM_ASM_000430 /TAXON_ID=97485 /ORGANISM="Prymnesium parvum, Strain Texoma1" /LENGTH=69 /DNA_ID=CAMNT_0053246125 /DNA_START=128 /DNA_END=338 /DNA_ORIENTATION=-